MKRAKRRESFFFDTILHYFNTLAEKTKSGPVLGLTLIFTWLPATVCGCSWADIGKDVEEETIALRFLDGTGEIIDGICNIDILIFNDDHLQRLDSYQKVSSASCSSAKAVSSSGKKIIYGILNGQRDRYGWADINSREAMSQICADLEKESREALLMSGECHATAGGGANMYLRRLCSEVRLRSICCDFSGRPYSEAVLTNARAYLINVNAEASITYDDQGFPKRIINAGGLNMNNLESFREPDMILQEIGDRIGREKIYPDISLLCYPNESDSEGPGSPYTRLVIEGQVNGRTYYWPVNIGAEEDGPGVGRNRQYIYDIRLTRLGQDNPDTPAETLDIETFVEVKEWREREEYGVRF